MATGYQISAVKLTRVQKKYGIYYTNLFLTDIHVKQPFARLKDSWEAAVASHHAQGYVRHRQPLPAGGTRGRKRHPDPLFQKVDFFRTSWRLIFKTF